MQKEVNELLHYKAKELMTAPWKWDEELQGEGIIGLCKGCPNIMEREKKTYCILKSCFEAKKKVWIQNYLNQASLLSGIQVVEEEKLDTPSYSLNTFSSYNSAEQETLRKSIAGHCENLRLIYEERVNSNNEKDQDYLAGIGFPHARIVCGKRNGFCACKNAAEKGVDIKTGDGVIDQERLREIRRLERERLKLNRQRIAEMKAETTEQIFKAMKEQDLKVWKVLFQSCYYETDWRDAVKNATSVDQLLYAMITRNVQSRIWNEKPKDALDSFNSFLASMGLEPLDIEMEPEEEPKGKTLMEVLAVEDE